MHRLQRVLSHLESNTQAKLASNASEEEVVIVSALRTPIGRARKGGFRDTHVEDMLAPVLEAVIKQSKLSPSMIGDVVVGSVLGKNVQRANEARIACFMAGLPHEVPVHVVNRQCSSGLQAIAHVAAAIKSGYYDAGIGAGVESMSSAVMGWQGKINPKIFMDPKTKACLLPMGITSENVAKKFGVQRKEMDQLSALSHQKAARATESGRFQNEIVPIKTTVKDRKTGKELKVTVSADEGIRKTTTPQVLARLRPAFDKKGCTTAGNSSQVSDGAAAVVCVKGSLAKAMGLKPLGIFKGFAVAGVPPEVMGIGPVPAIRAVLKQTGLSIKDIDLFEINEAFASQACYCVKELGIDMDKVNVNGGAIAIGHPLGMTGARMTATLLHEMRRRGAKYGIVSMCIGSGMGAAAVYECTY
mmetsp:Transcript_11311/g.13453  ORF Transcript_11311/g.13453 Transcript_11311/m.13453 type:complete len:415 (-) Transcript_11311:46-1290(-)|eukprot:jgi/Bigna1/56067/estExt_Genewise1Plus.C_820002